MTSHSVKVTPGLFQHLWAHTTGPTTADRAPLTSQNVTSAGLFQRLVLLLNWVLLLLLFPFRRRTMMRVPTAMVGRRARERDAATRRGMAIRRAKEEDGEDGDERRSVGGFWMMRTARGETLFTRSWTPVTGKIRGLVLVMHGLNEHSGRYNNFAKQLNNSGFKVYAMDWIGHGGSDGLHGYVHSLDLAVDDLKIFVEKILLDNPGLPCFIFGHSTGAAIVLKAVTDLETKAYIKGIVLTSPAVRVQPSHPVVAVIAPIFSLLVPKCQFNAYSEGPPVCRDPEALKSKYSDPLVFTGTVRVRTGYEILKITSYLDKNLSKVTIPFLVLHGTSDNVTDPEATKKLYHESESKDKSIRLYKGFLHDLLFEPEKDEIMRDIIDWLSSKI